MAARLIRLKIALLRGSLRTGPWQVVGTVIAYVAAAGACVLTLGICVALRTASTGVAADAVVVLGSLLVLGWAIIPVLAFGVDETLDPGRFAVLPVRGRALVPGLTVAGLVGAPGLVAVAAAVGSVLVWTRGVVAAGVAVVAAVVAVLTCVAASRVVTASTARLLSGRRARDATSLVAAVVISLIAMLPLLVMSVTSAGLALDGVAAALSWTPLGAAWAAPGLVAQGHLAGGLTRLALGVVFLVAAVAGWARMLDRQLTQPPLTGGGGRRRGRARRSLLDRVPATAGPTWAVAARSLLYLRRDPRYVAALIAPVVVVTVPIFVALATPGPDGFLVMMGPLASLIIGLVSANDVGYDGSAFAAHVATGVPGRADRAGRAAALLSWAVPASLAATVLTAVVAGGPPGLIPGLAGISLALLLGCVGAGAVTGALAPFPMPEAGTNPFRANSGATARGTLAQLGVSSVGLITALPATALTVAALAWSAPPLLWLALAAGPPAGAAVLATGIVIGGRVVDARGAEMLDAVRRRL